MLPIRPDEIITDVLGLNLSEPEEIDTEGLPSRFQNTEPAGLLRRDLRMVVVAKKFPLLIRRFTQAHEVGHWLLHPQLISHRDLPVIGMERIDERQPLEEREASLFAAEILMSRRLVKDLFAARYGPRIHPDEIDENFAFRLTLGTDRVWSIEALRSIGRRQRSRLIAVDRHAGLPFTELFAVSVAAMAIRLEELDLLF